MSRFPHEFYALFGSWLPAGEFSSLCALSIALRLWFICGNCTPPGLGSSYRGGGDGDWRTVLPHLFVCHIGLMSVQAQQFSRLVRSVGQSLRCWVPFSIGWNGITQSAKFCSFLQHGVRVEQSSRLSLWFMFSMGFLLATNESSSGAQKCFSLATLKSRSGTFSNWMTTWLMKFSMELLWD